MTTDRVIQLNAIFRRARTTLVDDIATLQAAIRDRRARALVNGELLALFARQ
jgi:hypothetical protein